MDALERGRRPRHHASLHHGARAAARSEAAHVQKLRGAGVGAIAAAARELRLGLAWPSNRGKGWSRTSSLRQRNEVTRRRATKGSFAMLNKVAFTMYPVRDM